MRFEWQLASICYTIQGCLSATVSCLKIQFDAWMLGVTDRDMELLHSVAVDILVQIFMDFSIYEIFEFSGSTYGCESITEFQWRRKAVCGRGRPYNCDRGKVTLLCIFLEFVMRVLLFKNYWYIDKNLKFFYSPPKSGGGGNMVIVSLHPSVRP